MPNKKILILGGYGNFGARISLALAKSNCAIIIAGRDEKKANQLQAIIQQKYPHVEVETAVIDIHHGLDKHLKQLKPAVVINTCGPFQLENYDVVECCIEARAHYIDLADGRDFVNNIVSLHDKAVAHNVLVVSGSSTVPGLSSAVIAKYKPEFAQIDSLVYGITPGQKATRGLATTESILTYLGKPLKPFNASNQKVYGWQQLYRVKYPKLGQRWMSTCDIPDLDLFPKKYGIHYIQFSAGMENSFLHLGMWLTSWLVRMGLPIPLTKHAKALLQFSHVFDRFGTDAGGMHMWIKGKDHAGKPKEIKWYIIATQGDGPQIPCVPAIVIARKLVEDHCELRGAYPCVEMLTLEEYMDELKDFAVSQYVLNTD